MRALIGNRTFLSTDLSQAFFGLYHHESAVAAPRESISPGGVGRPWTTKRARRAHRADLRQDGKLSAGSSSRFTPGSVHPRLRPLQGRAQEISHHRLLIIRKSNATATIIPAEEHLAPESGSVYRPPCIWSQKRARHVPSRPISGSRCWGVRKHGSGKLDEAELSWLPPSALSTASRSRNGVDPDGVGVGCGPRVSSTRGVPRAKVEFTHGKTTTCVSCGPANDMFSSTTPAQISRTLSRHRPI